MAVTDAHGHTTTFALDGLYRAVATTSAPVLGEALSSGLKAWTTTRRFELTGNPTREEDGNHHATVRTYDSFGRLASVVDALQRTEERAYDKNSNLTQTRLHTGPAADSRVTATTFDALNRPLDTTDTFATTAGPRVYLSQTRYDDVGHSVTAKDARGYLTTRTLDGLDRVATQVVDDASSAALSRSGTTPASPLRLTTRLTYDANGARASQTDALGRVTTEVHDGLGRLASRSLPMGVAEAFSYDGEGHQTSHTDGRGVITDSSFDALARPRVTRLDECLFTGVCVSPASRLKVHETQYVDVPDAEALTRTDDFDALGHRTQSFTDALGRTCKAIDADSKVQAWRFDAAVKTVEADKKGYVTAFTSDAVNRVTRIDDFDVGASTPTYSQTTAFDDTLRTTVKTDRGGIATLTQLDGLGRTEVSTRTGKPGVTPAAAPQVDSFLYDEASHEVRHTDANGHAVVSAFDSAGRKVSSVAGFGTPEAATTAFTFDDVGNRTSMKVLGRTATAFDSHDTYDDLNRSVRTEDANNHVTSRAFDEAGNLVCEKRPLGGSPLARGAAGGLTVASLQQAVCQGSFVTRYSFDELSKLLSVTDALGGVSSYVYDEARNLLSKQDAKAGAGLSLCTYAYDALNRRVGEFTHLDLPSSLLGGHLRLLPADRALAAAAGPRPNNAPLLTSGTLDETWSYDVNGNELTYTDSLGQVKASAHGILNRLESEEYSLHATVEFPSLEAIEYSYTPNGSLESVREDKRIDVATVTPQVTLRSYDSLERLAAQQRFDGKVTTYGYDVKGNRTLVSDYLGVATTYSFDALDRLKTASFAPGTTTYSYFPDGLLNQVAGFNGVNEGRCYDAAGQLTGISSGLGTVPADCSPAPTPLSQFGYGYDDDGNRVLQRETRGAALAEVTDYGFDELDRLVVARYPGEAVLYSLDAVGNRVGEKKALPSKVLALTAAAFAALAPADALASVQATFNRADWLVTRAQQIPAGPTTRYVFDAAGSRVGETDGTASKTYVFDARHALSVAASNGLQVGRYDYDWQGQRILRRTATGRVDYVLDDKYVLNEFDGLLGAPAAVRRYHYAKQPLAVTDSGGTRFLGVDSLGSISDETNLLGASVSKRQYDAWGQYRNGTAPTAAEPKLGFTGHQFDDETGLTYARARYLDNKLGVFLSRDANEGSLNDAPSMHRFAYVKNNPARYVDFAGRCWALPGSGDTGCARIGFAALQAKIATDYQRATEFSVWASDTPVLDQFLLGPFVQLAATANQTAVSLAVVTLGYGQPGETISSAEQSLNMLNPAYAALTHSKEMLEIDSQAKRQGGYTLKTGTELTLKALELGTDVANGEGLARTGAGVRNPVAATPETVVETNTSVGAARVPVTANGAGPVELNGGARQYGTGGNPDLASEVAGRNRPLQMSAPEGGQGSSGVGDLKVGDAADRGGKPSLSAAKDALKEVHEKVGKLPKGEPGKFGSPQAGTPKKGYRLDPGHPNAPAGSPETGPHINWWDYTTGKRGSGGSSGAVPIVE